MPSLSQSSRGRNPLANTNASRHLRAAVYHRVSSEEQLEGYSLDAQARATSLYCEAHGWTIANEYRDEGKSARTDDMGKRPAFAQMLADAEDGLVEVIVVHKLDRFARNLRVTLETLERLERLGVGFVSINEQMDFTSPIGKVILATLAAFAQYYSDNLSWETRKGKQERKAQGLYNGLLPFGLKKSREGLPVPDPETYPGLLLAFQLAAEGKSDRAIAEALNAAGYRTTGNRGRNPFSKDTVRPMLMNRFYLGQLPDGQGGWIPGAHDAVLDEDLFDAAQKARESNRVNRDSVGLTRRVYALSGLGVCGYCGGRLHMHTRPNGTAEIYCYRARQAAPCGQRCVPLAPIEQQIADYLGTFQLPNETVQEVIALFDRATRERNDTERRRHEITNRLERLAELYTWGDTTREAYQAERDRLQGELATLRTTTARADLLSETAAFLRDLPTAWATASPEQRNTLARLVFRSVAVRDDELIGVEPQPDFAPFFLLLTPPHGDTPDPTGPGCQGSGLTYGSDGYRLCEVDTAMPVWAHLVDYRPRHRRRSSTQRYVERQTAISPEDWPTVSAIVAEYGLREAARRFGVSHETVRKIARQSAE